MNGVIVTSASHHQINPQPEWTGDQGQMLPRLDEVKADYGAGPETLLADAGYCNEADLACLEERGVDGYVVYGETLTNVPASVMASRARS